MIPSLVPFIYTVAFIRTIEACGNSGMKPYESWTKIRHPKSLNWKERPGSIKIFKCAGKKSHKGTTIANMQELENVILGREGVLHVLSPPLASGKI